MLAPPDEGTYVDSKKACETHDIPYEDLRGADLNERFPGYNLPSDHRAVYQPDGGFLDSEQCIVAHVNTAHTDGAGIQAREAVET